ncbi:MAG: hypothetical protein BGO69_05375 [Bacteroidetes bacterium 46-16]|nr:MAG: hypothetical protein BGO69_05375 [Bacteroidetes bacterium 46-16]
MDLISLEDHVNEIYNETAKRVAKVTPQLFTFKDIAADTIQPHGSSVLFKANNTHYMLTARHCVHQGDSLVKFGVLDAGGHLRLLSGDVFSSKGIYDEIDLALIKLQPQSVAILSECYKFLDVQKLRPTINIPDKTDYLIVGHPLSRTSIDNKKRKLKYEPLVYISKSVPAEVYQSSYFKQAKTFEKFQFDRSNTILLNFNKRKSRIVAADDMTMSPDPQGISGCGIWYIQSYEIADPAEADFYLMGIIIEHDADKRLLIGTRSEVIASLLQASILKKV